MASAGNMERRNMVEAVRAATLTVHAAAGLVRHGDQQAVRLLRASEGLCRAALAVLLQPAAAPSPRPPTATKDDDAPRNVMRGRRRRPRGKRGRGTQKDDEKVEDDDGRGAKEDAAAVAASGPPPELEAASEPREAGLPPELDDAWADQAARAVAQEPAPAVDRNDRAFARGSRVLVANSALEAGRYAHLEELGVGVVADLRPADNPTFARVEFQESSEVPAAVHTVALGDLVVLWSDKEVKATSKKSRRRK